MNRIQNFNICNNVLDKVLWRNQLNKNAFEWPEKSIIEKIWFCICSTFSVECRQKVWRLHYSHSWQNPKTENEGTLNDRIELYQIFNCCYCFWGMKRQQLIINPHHCCSYSSHRYQCQLPGHGHNCLFKYDSYSVVIVNGKMFSIFPFYE